jgi:Lar family restriction alleviation protein
MTNEYNKAMAEKCAEITTKLKPCPFCGGEAIVCHIQSEPGVKIECEICGIGTPWYWSGTALARKWNKRNGD